MDPPLDLFLVLRSIVSPFQIGEGLFSNEGPIEFVLDVATGTFSFALFALTLYAWTRRSRQPTLLIVSIGFLTFFVKQLIEALPLSPFNGELFASVMDFATLAIFFVALVIKPRRKEEVRSEVNDMDSS